MDFLRCRLCLFLLWSKKARKKRNGCPCWVSHPKRNPVSHLFFRGIFVSCSARMRLGKQPKPHYFKKNNKNVKIFLKNFYKIWYEKNGEIRYLVVLCKSLFFDEKYYLIFCTGIIIIKEVSLFGIQFFVL